MDQLIFIDKPAGMSSFGAVARVRRVLSEQAGHKVKVGHTGTLDPFATGLLILLTGRATKRAPEFLKLDKVYKATLCLGARSSTGDPEGEITPSPIPLPLYTLADLSSAAKHFVGKISQTPPAFSAVKVNGERAYRLARAGKIVNLPARTVEVYSLEILSYDAPYLTLRAHVSSGTYLRSLATDFGERLGCGAYLTALRRTQIAGYRLADLPLFPLPD